ncbi:MAG: Sec-independent protein translocase protein TatB, partial [SAR324 cluster bacterium]|nr:Sec-independent protein translocase protein TatB [SAR324 cluster bacterium]
MFGIGLPEMIVIAIVALVFIGPKNLPGVLRSVGRGLVQLKRATNEVRTTVQDEMDQIEREIDLKDVREAATDL